MALLLPASAHAAVLYNGFGSSEVGATTPLGWSTSGSGSSSITADHYLAMSAANTSVFSQYDTGNAIARTAGEGFKLTSTFSGTSGPGQYENTGFFFMNSSGTTNGPRLLFNMGSSNTGLLEFAGASSQTNGSLGTSGYNTLEEANAVYTMTLTGIFNSGGVLVLTATLTNNINSTVVTSTATVNSIDSGNNYFGIRTASGGDIANPSATAIHQSYVLETIPEPSHTLMLAAGGLAMLARRRRKA